jgi:hypothetical protein
VLDAAAGATAASRTITAATAAPAADRAIDRMRPLS